MIPHDAEVIDRDTLERVAKVVGPHSAAAKALEEADASASPSDVVFLKTRNTILVLKTKPEAK